MWVYVYYVSKINYTYLLCVKLIQGVKGPLPNTEGTDNAIT